MHDVVNAVPYYAVPVSKSSSLLHEKLNSRDQNYPSTWRHTPTLTLSALSSSLGELILKIKIIFGEDNGIAGRSGCRNLKIW